MAVLQVCQARPVQITLSCMLAARACTLQALYLSAYDLYTTQCVLPADVASELLLTSVEWPARVQALPGVDVSPGSKEWLHHVQEQASGPCSSAAVLCSYSSTRCINSVLWLQ